MKWIIAAPFITTAEDRWLGAFVPGSKHGFTTLPTDEIVRSGPQTSARGWKGHFSHAWRALKLARRQPGTGLITVFPQLAIAAGLLAMLPGRRVRIIAWTFNIGTLPRGLKRILSILALRRVDAVIVHALSEVEDYSRHFCVPPERVVFVPLQRIIPDVGEATESTPPYAISLGSANRDYRLLFEALKIFPVRTIVVASEAAIAGLEVPPCVEVMSGLSLDKCHQLLTSARLSIIPVANPKTASGQVTLLNSMGLGRATIITRCPGSLDYVIDGETARLVQPGDAVELSQALRQLWEDTVLRDRLGRGGRDHVARNYSDAAIGRLMGQVCDAVEAGQPPRITR